MKRQYPTCTNTRIYSVNDAHKVFYAVQQGILQMVTRRLDADERTQLRSGCVYAWEERSTHTELTGLGIERFTEGRRWSPSRVRDEFLFYYEKYLPSFDCANSHPPRDWDPLIKQTYSAWVETGRGRRKWHLTAYFTQATIDQLDSVDNMRVVCDLIVPENMFKSARITKSRGKNDGARIRESSKLPSASMTSGHVSSPAQTPPSQPDLYGQILMFQPCADHHPSHNVQTEVLDQQFLSPVICSSSSSPINIMDFQDPNQPGTEAYRSFSFSSHSQNPADNIHREYNYMSQTSSDACLSQTQSSSEQTPPTHTTAAFSPGDLSLPVTSYDNVHAYSSHDQFFSSTPSWENVNSDSGIPSSSTYHQDESTNLITPVTSPESYLSSHTEINEPESYQIMALSPNECPTRGGTPQESLPSLNMLHQTYSISYDFSVSMVPPATIAPPCESCEAFSNRPSISATESSQKAKVLLGSDGMLRDLDLAPLNALSRRQPYRREPADDEALRQLPRSP